jgi:hypothetical protein
VKVSVIRAKNTSQNKDNRSDDLTLLRYLRHEHGFRLSELKVVFKTRAVLEVFSFRGVTFDFRGRR